MVYHKGKKRSAKNSKYPRITIYVGQELDKEIDVYLARHVDLDRSKLVRAALVLYLEQVK